MNLLAIMVRLDARLSANFLVRQAIKASSTFQSTWNLLNDLWSDGSGSRRSLASKFSCHPTEEGSNNDSPVKALLPGRGDLLRLSRVGRWLLAYAFLALAKLLEERTTRSSASSWPDDCRLPQITLHISDHGRQRQTKV